MKFEDTRTFGWETAIIGCRLPYSKDWNDAKKKIDSTFYENGEPLLLGADDLRVCKNRIKADDMEGKTGSPESKFLRMIHVQVGITAPLAFWKEYATYKVATVENSTSTMHTISKYQIVSEMFEHKPNGELSRLIHIDEIEKIRQEYLETKNKDLWYDLIYGLGDSWLQTRACDLNYLTIRNMYCWRKDHKQNCWSGKDNSENDNFIKWVKTLPYAKELITDGE